MIGPSTADETDPRPPTPWTFLFAVFALEVFGLIGFGRWGWWLGSDGVTETLGAAAMIGVAATVWGVFRVRNDPPGKVNPPVRVPGWLRFVLELSFYGLAATGLWLSGWRAASETLITAVAIIYLVMWDRQRWLLSQR